MNARSLLLNGWLIGIAPRADLEPTADPAQSLGGIRRAGGAADRALGDTRQLIRDHRSLGFLQELPVDHRLGDR